MQSGSQDVSLGDGCTTGNAIHEIGHTVGLWHEQSREDRDSYVQIHWENIEAGKEHNFDQHISDGDDVGAYDYGSIMHYPRDAFSSNGQDTITPTNPSTASIGQRTALSAGDIAAVASMYGSGTVGVKKVVDDPPVGVKKISDDHVPIKKVVDDPPVGVKKISDDHVPIKKVVDDPPVGVKKISDDHVPIKKVADDTRTIPTPVTGPGPVSGGGLQPFLLATPHHADLGSAGEVVAALEMRLAAAAAAVAEARRNVVALQTALNAAVSALATAEENYSAVVAQVQQLG
jgi:predicted transcriptional regulator